MKSRSIAKRDVLIVPWRTLALEVVAVVLLEEYFVAGSALDVVVSLVVVLELLAGGCPSGFC